MHKFFMILAAAFFITTAPSMAADPASGITPDVKIKVNGMVCDFCARAIDKVFRKQEAVNDVEVNLDDALILVDLKDGQSLDNETITKMVTDSGYDIQEIIHQ